MSPAKRSVEACILNIIQRLELCRVVSCCADQYIRKNCLIKDKRKFKARVSWSSCNAEEKRKDVNRKKLHFVAWLFSQGR
jgi:hypothetical protein